MKNTKGRPTYVAALTDAEKAQMSAWAEKWIERSLSTEPADRPYVEGGIRAAYRFAGLGEPRIVWVPSPAVLAVAGPLAAVHLALGSPRDAVSDAVRGAVSGAVSDAVRDAVGGAVSDAVGDAVGGAVSDAVRGAVRGAVSDAVSGAVSDQRKRKKGAESKVVVLDAIANWWQGYHGGAWWNGWYWGSAYATFFRDVVGLDLPGDTWERSRANEAMCSAGWLWFHKDFCLVSERPAILRREDGEPTAVRRLHCVDGPAVQWRDGTSLWFIHGIQVPREVCEAPETLAVERILGEQNTEVRRVMIERRGIVNVLRDGNAALVSEDDYGKLWRLDLADDEPIVMVEMVDSTPIHQLGAGATLEEVCASLLASGQPVEHKTYWERVPPGTRTALEGLAWQASMTPAEYARIAVQT